MIDGVWKCCFAMAMTDNFNKMLFIKDCCYLLYTCKDRVFMSCPRERRKVEYSTRYLAHTPFSERLYTQRGTYVLLLYHRSHSEALEYSISQIDLSFYIFIMVLTKLENCVIILRCIKRHAFEYLSLCNNVKHVHS